MADIPDKLFFKIGEVSSITQLEPHILRYWETEFQGLHPKKNDSGQRLYVKRDVELIFRIKKLLYEDGFTILGAKKKLSRKSKGNDIIPENGSSEGIAMQQTLDFDSGDSYKSLKEIKSDLKTVLSLLSY